MHVIAKKALVEFYEKHAAAKVPLLNWHKVAENCKAQNLMELKQTFAGVDYVPENQYVFNIGGNNYRLIADVRFGWQKMFIRYIFTHEEYDEWTQENRRK